MSGEIATLSEAAVAQTEPLVKEEVAEEEQPTYHELQPAAATRGHEISSLGLEEEEQEQVGLARDSRFFPRDVLDMRSYSSNEHLNTWKRRRFSVPHRKPNVIPVVQLGAHLGRVCLFFISKIKIGRC